jgi:hypothetical protein
MAEYRHTQTGEVKTQGQWRSHYSNVSLPRAWKQATLDGLNLEAVLASPAATTGAYQTSVRDGVVQDANGNWVENYVARDMFADTTDDDGVTTTKAQHEAAYQAGLDATVAEYVRTQRNNLLNECDWVAIKARELGQSIQEDWYAYRGDLRQIPEQEGFPHTITWPSKP